MTPTAGTAAQAASAAIVLLAYILAIRDWNRMPALEGHAVTDDAAARVARRWAGAALFLVALMALLQGVAFGGREAWGFLNGAGIILILKGAGLLALIPAGAAWAARNGSKPFRAVWRGWKAWPWGLWLLALAVMLAWTWLLQWSFHTRANLDRARVFSMDRMPPPLRWPMLIALITLAPILEESLFRHYLLYRLIEAFKQKPHVARAAAVILTSLLWSIGHVGAIEPYWLKLLQTAAMGLLLGGVALRWGLEGAIALHWAFNLALIPLALAMQ